MLFRCELTKAGVPFWDGLAEMGWERVYGNWTVSCSLIRNLDEAFWFGTLRVIEQASGTGTKGLRDWGLGIKGLD
jgi:hypothetical protein